MKNIFIGSISPEEAIVLVDQRLSNLVSEISEFEEVLETIQDDESEDYSFSEIKNLYRKSEDVKDTCHKLNFIVDDLFETFNDSFEGSIEDKEIKEINDSLP